MFQTYKRDIYYRREDGTWFVENDNRRLMVGWKCIGSINITNILEDSFGDSQLLGEKIGEQLQIGAPEGFILGFKTGNHPLVIKEDANGYKIHMGMAIREVYKWI